MNIPLNYQLLTPEIQNLRDRETTPILLLHGLFGSLENLNIIGRNLVSDYPILAVDLRNHGESQHTTLFDYPTMAADVSALIMQLGWRKCHVIGHSMGGKVAMYLTQLIPEITSSLIVLDMAPVSYTQRRHDSMFRALNAVIEQKVQTRPEAKIIMQNDIDDFSVIQFLLKSFQNGHWCFNLQSLEDNYQHIIGWEPAEPWHKPTLFLCGGNSDYVIPKYRTAIQKQFPNARAHVISGASHWLHADKPDSVNNSIRRFLNSIQS